VTVSPRDAAQAGDIGSATAIRAHRQGSANVLKRRVMMTGIILSILMRVDEFKLKGGVKAGGRMDPLVCEPRKLIWI
jgi:hypothetical protein